MRQRTDVEKENALTYSFEMMMKGLEVEAKTELGQKILRQVLSELHSNAMFIAYGGIKMTKYDKDVIEAMKGNTSQTQNKAR